jgi:hypothetical protein
MIERREREAKALQLRAPHILLELVTEVLVQHCLNAIGLLSGMAGGRLSCLLKPRLSLRGRVLRAQ